MLAVPSATAAPLTLYSNLGVDGRIGIAGRPASPGVLEVEPADDFIVTTPVAITDTRFIGLVPDTASIVDVNLEIYRVFPLDSTTPPSGQVPTRNNSPSDVAFASRGTADFTSVTSSTLASGFSVPNSVIDGIHPSPGQTTGGEGPARGNEVVVDVSLNNDIVLAPGHYFFVPQVQLSDGTFLWLSASRPIAGVGSTPIAPDLQAWIRNSALDPDWLRVGTDIVGGAPAPTYNMAFRLQARSVPEPATLLLMGSGLGPLLYSARRRMKHFR
jgi:hypothetical protein